MPDSDDAAALHYALVELGFDVPVEEELVALTASAGNAGNFILAAILSGPAGFWYAFCKTLGKRLAAGETTVLNQIFGRRNVTLRDSDKGVDARVEPGVPPEAVEELATPPAAPSGLLLWDKTTREWRDSSEV